MLLYKLGDKTNIPTTSALLCRPNTVITNKIRKKNLTE